jgi:hypothetical protein
MIRPRSFVRGALVPMRNPRYFPVLITSTPTPGNKSFVFPVATSSTLMAAAVAQQVSLEINSRCVRGKFRILKTKHDAARSVDVIFPGQDALWWFAAVNGGDPQLGHAVLGCSAGYSTNENHLLAIE